MLAVVKLKCTLYGVPLNQSELHFENEENPAFSFRTSFIAYVYLTVALHLLNTLT